MKARAAGIFLSILCATMKQEIRILSGVLGEEVTLCSLIKYSAKAVTITHRAAASRETG